MSNVIVVGGGAAGMMAAIFAARNGQNVTLLEKNEKLGKKIFITGKGRCNITNASEIEDLFSAESFCGPCFGAGDTPANGELSIRHTTRNFPNREGSKPGEGQMAGVALMDARSIAATAANGGILTAADEVLTEDPAIPPYTFDTGVYANRVYNGWGRPEPDYELRFGPNIKDWPEQPALTDDLLVKVVSHITDPVTTTDELIPSGETSAYRSNPLRLAEFTLSRRDPA